MSPCTVGPQRSEKGQRRLPTGVSQESGQPGLKRLSQKSQDQLGMMGKARNHSIWEGQEFKVILDYIAGSRPARAP